MKRPTTRNTSLEQAKFEVLNHKYTDLSELRCGAAVLNDCKYGILLNGSRMALSLHKGGLRPDHMGDKDGLHRCVYSFLPHDSGFNARDVIHPAYMLNYPVLTASGKVNVIAPAVPSHDNIIVETVKPCEDAECAYIVRLYEAEGCQTKTQISVPSCAERIYVTNMLEEVQQELPLQEQIPLTFRPFEIKTLKISYKGV